MNTGSRSLTRRTDVGEDRRLAADVGPRRAAGEHVRAAPRRAAARSSSRRRRVLRARRREGDRATPRRRAATAAPAARPRRSPGRRAPRSRSGPTTPGSLGDVDGDDQRTVGAGAEALRDQVVGPPLGPRPAACPRRGMPSRSASTGAARASSSTVAPDGVRHGVPRVTCSTHLDQRPPIGVSGPRRGRAARPAVDPVPGEPEERRQQRDRGEHHDQHDDRDRDPTRGDERDAGDGQAEDRHDDRAAGEDHRPGRRWRAPGRPTPRPAARGRGTHGAGSRRTARSRCRRPRPTMLPRPPAPSWGCRRRRRQRQRADTDRQPEQRHPDRQAHRDQRPEGQQQDDARREQPDELAELAAASSKAKNRSPPISIAAATRRAGLGTEALEVFRSAGGELARPPGTAPAARPPGRRPRPTPLLCRADRRERPTGSLVPSTCGRRCGGRLERRPAPPGLRRVEERRGGVQRGQDHLGGQAGVARRRRRPCSSIACCESSPGT